MRFYIDTEFIVPPAEMGRSISLLSIGIVAEDEREMYAQHAQADFALADAFVRAQVLPHLVACPYQPNLSLLTQPSWHTYDGGGERKARVRCAADCPWRSQEELRDAVYGFISAYDGRPEFWGDATAFDYVALSWLFGDMADWPSGWPYHINDIQTLDTLYCGVTLPAHGADEHGALADARWVRAAYHAFMDRIEMDVGTRERA